jgi:hypothetical protein
MPDGVTPAKAVEEALVDKGELRRLSFFLF